MIDYIVDAWNYLNTLNPGLTLGAIGWLGYVCRQVPEKIFNIIDQNFSVTIQTTNDYYVAYWRTSEWLFNSCPKLKYHVSDKGNVNGLSSVTIADGNYGYFLNWLTYIMISKTKVANHGSDEVKYDIFIKIIGLDRMKYLEDYKKFIKIKRETDYIDTYNTVGHGCFTVPKKYFKDIYLDILPDLKKILDNFIANEEIYKDHGITYKLGLCFYGPGGVGKSILCRAIATYLDWDLVIVKNRGVHSNFNIENVNSVIVLEELDLYCGLNRENMPNTTIAEEIGDGEESYIVKPVNQNTPEMNQTIMLQNLLTFLDGITSPNHCIIIATTNYIDRIDPILLRPGRFDYKFELTYMNREKAIQMCNNFNVPVDEIITEEIEFPCSPAVIQNKILHYITEK